MATSGTVYTSYGDSSRFYVYWERTGTWNDSTCGSTIKWYLYLDNHNWWYNNAIKCYTIYINGVAVYNGGTWSNITSYGSHLLASGETSIQHANDGTKSFEISFSGWFYANSNVSGKGSFTLDTIPRASSFGTITGTTIGSNMTININRNSSNFTHSLWYIWGDGTWHGIASNVGASHTWTIPASLASEIPNATSGIMTLVLRTYNGSTQVGNDATKTISLAVPSSYAPSISSIGVSEAVSGLASQFGCFVRYKSKLKITVNAGGSYGSTIKSYATSVEGRNYTAQTFETAVLNNVGSVGIASAVTDSRGRSASKSTSVTVVDYYNPQATYIAVERCRSDGTIDDEGTYASIRYIYNIAPVNNKNSKVVKLQYWNGSAWSDLTTLSGYSGNGTYVSTATFSLDNEYEFRLYVADYFTSTSNQTKMRTGFTLINYGESGKSIGFGKVAQHEEGIEFGLDVYDQYNTHITNGMAVYNDGSVDPNTTLEHTVLTERNTPTGEFMYINTYFYADKSVTANRAQTAIPYHKNGDQYHRYFYNGVWSEWRTIGLTQIRYVIPLSGSAGAHTSPVIIPLRTGETVVAVNCFQSSGSGFFTYSCVFNKKENNFYVWFWFLNSVNCEMNVDIFVASAYLQDPSRWQT